MRIGPIVEDDESGIDGELLVAIRDFDRVYVPADAIISFEHGNFMLVVQPIGNNVACDAGSDYRDLHDRQTNSCRGGWLAWILDSIASHSGMSSASASTISVILNQRPKLGKKALILLGPLFMISSLFIYLFEIFLGPGKKTLVVFT